MTTYVRVKDESTGHEFDLPEGHHWIVEGSVKQVKEKQYPPSHVARPPKFHVDPEALGAPSATE